jgi:hypothetical protein
MQQAIGRKESHAKNAKFLGRSETLTAEVAEGAEIQYLFVSFAFSW